MDWSDEHYVKLYTRRTATYALWPWQARALLGPLLCALDKAGTVDVGTRRPAAESLGALVLLPSEVVAAGLEAMLADGTVELENGRLVMPKFLEAQEARKTEAAKARDYRERRRDKARAKEAGLLTPTVTPRTTASHGVTPNHPPSPALPVPDPKKHLRAAEKPAAPPRLKPLQERLEQVFGSVRGGARYKHGGAKDTQALKALLPVASDDEIARRWAIGLKAVGWASCSTFAQLGSKWNDLGAPVERGKGAAWQTGDTDWTNQPKSFAEGLTE